MLSRRIEALLHSLDAYWRLKVPFLICFGTYKWYLSLSALFYIKVQAFQCKFIAFLFYSISSSFYSNLVAVTVSSIFWYLALLGNS
ncbi:hypothetical protein E3N88_45416 [Mikania micrantha]|uniref:Uncharacterized protein n=1 Tax=Mikania micrantha TaxID=192012 RepID=A0A5N6L9E6_9ASTR|nr:hypothetical protein E3N88_45416 [Mikania micrantha]